MATTTFQPDQSPAVFIGNWAARASYASRQARQASGTGDLWALNITGTDATLSCFCGGATSSTTISVSVDGGAFSNYTTPTGFSYQAVPLFTGLSDAAHVVVVRQTSADAIEATTTALSVTGASPAVAAPTGWNPYYRLNDNPSGIAIEGIPVATAYNQKVQYNASNPTLAVVRFKATTAQIRASYAGVNAQWALVTDGVTSGTLSTVTAGDFVLGSKVIFSGLDGSNEHTYELALATYATSGNGNLEGIFVDGLNTTALAARTPWAFYGDSITAGYLGTSNSTKGWSWLLSQAKGKQNVNRGYNGTTVVPGGSTSGQNRTADITGISPAPEVLIVFYGINDISLNTSAGTFQTAYQSMISTIATALTTTQIYCVGFWYSASNSGLIPGYNSAIQAVVGSVGGLVRYVDPTPMLSAPYSWVTGTDTSDGTHMNASGNTKFANFLSANTPPFPPAISARRFVGSNFL